VEAFAVVIALLAVAGVGWALSALARRALRRRGIPTDQSDVEEASGRRDDPAS
jgi:hypothetical protein